jgi:hypothetical protein
MLEVPDGRTEHDDHEKYRIGNAQNLRFCTSNMQSVCKRNLLSLCAPVAQLDRASGYEPEGREFESLRAHHSFSPENKVLPNLALLAG